MATKKEVLKSLTSLKGIGTVKAEAIIGAGYDSIEKIQQASIEELTNINGISDSIATSLKNQLAESEPAEKPKETPEKPTEIKEQKKETEKPEKTAEKPKQKKKPKKSMEVPEEYIVKKKPSISKENQHYLTVRKKRKKQTPRFLRQEWFRYKRIPKNWHRPDGITSKMRMNKRYRAPRVRVGYRGPKQVRGLHPSGFEEVLIHNVSDLEHIDAGTQAARIGSTVGTKKRVAIIEKAKELDIRLLNK
jgi:large subunit ribosomal protein L32e